VYVSRSVEEEEFKAHDAECAGELHVVAEVMAEGFTLD